MSWLGNNQVSVVRNNECPRAFSIYQKLSKTSMERSIENEECVPFVYAFVTKIQDGGLDIAVNRLELPVIPCENS